MNGVEVSSPLKVPCIDEDCTGQGEVEMDGETVYRECDECGSTWDFVRVRASGEFCQVGIPEEVRRAASSDVFETKTIPLQVKR